MHFSCVNFDSAKKVLPHLDPCAIPATATQNAEYEISWNIVSRIANQSSGLTETLVSSSNDPAVGDWYQSRLVLYASLWMC